MMDHRTFVFISTVLILSLGDIHSVEVVLSTDKLIQKVSMRFLSVAIDTGIIQHNWEKLNFSSPKVESLAKGLSPCFVRIGGTAADFCTFKPNGHRGGMTSDYPGSFLTDISQNQFDNFTMTGYQWDELNNFVRKVGWDVIFDLNSLIRKDGQWLEDNAEILMDYSSERGYKIAGWELGNEPNSYKHHLGYSISSSQRAKDYMRLQTLLQKYPQWRNCTIIGPSTTQLDKKEAENYFKGFLDSGGSSIVTNPTFHHYYVNGRETTLVDFLDPNIMDELIPEILTGKRIAAHPPYGKVWLGETSSAYGGGAPGLSDRYAAGFLWLDKLGISAAYGIDLVVRQSFYGGNYALLDSKTSDPNPDYWLSYLYIKLVGERVLNVTTDDTSRLVRLYAHCTNIQRSNYTAGSVTVYGMNLDTSPKTVSFKQYGPDVRLDFFSLQPVNGDLKSQSVMLNGRKLQLSSDYSLPNILTPVTMTGKVTIPAQSFGFIVLPSINVKVCY